MDANGCLLIVVSSDPDFIASNIPLVTGQEVVANDVGPDPQEFVRTIIDLGDLAALTDQQVAFLRRESVDVVMYWQVSPAEDVHFVDPVIDLVAWARDTFGRSSNVFLSSHIRPGYGRVLPIEATYASAELG